MDFNDEELNSESDEEDNKDDSSGSDEDESGNESSGSDDDDDDTDYDSDEEIIGNGENAESLKAFSSDDDPERENCPICLNKFFGQDLGTPESCDHTFCFECIKEWSKNINTCPIDRTEFNYIHMKISSDGSVLRKFEVKVKPKEPEDILEDHPTLCEVCHNGDREDRLLLCDGCDLAYHCECLDPPLYYIPIEEWFCSACSGVLDRRILPGPSRSTTRRIIPRTRASEAVRSRVQNLQRTWTARASSTSQHKKTSTQRTPKKRKRRSYRKAIRKVVTLARTKKDMSAGEKGKLGARNSTVIVTYRRRRKRRRRRTKKVSKRSSSKNIYVPSSKQRIAKHLGIGKPLTGSTVPQIKKTSGSRSSSISVKARLPSHSLFGNKDQLMDFSENFNEDIEDNKSTSFSGTSRRISTDACPSTSSGMNILDSILAGQKILHAKSDKILIKTDGSLILKEDTKKQTSVEKKEIDMPLRTPMSIALAKQGVRTSLSNKNSEALCKKHADSTKTKKSSNHKVPSEISFKLFKISSNDVKRFHHIEKNKSTSAAINDERMKTKKFTTSEVDYSISFNETCKISSNKNVLASNNKKNHLSIDNLNPIISSSPTTSSKVSESFIKKEKLYDEETGKDSGTASVEKIHIKQEILSDKETNIGSWNENTIDNEQKLNNVLKKIKKEPIDPDLNADDVKNYENLEINRNIKSENTYENDSSDFNASQSIINSEPYDINSTSEINECFKSAKLIKIKEEISSDSEDCSQSLLLNSSENFDRLSKFKTSFSIKKEPIDSNDTRKTKENIHQQKNVLRSSENKFCNQLPCTQTIPLLSNSESEDNDLLSIPAVTNDSEDDIPCTQALSQAISTDSEDDIPCTQAVSKDSEDDIACTQALFQASSVDSEDDEIPCTQVPCAATNLENDYLPPTQAISFSQINPNVDNHLPCTQATFNVSPDSDDDDDDDDHGDDDDDLPCTQAALISSTNRDTKFHTFSSYDSKLSKISGNQPLSTQTPLCIKIKDLRDEVSSTKTDFEFKKPSTVLKKVSINKNNNKCDRKNSNDSLSSVFSEYELPPTQLVTFSPILKHSNLDDVDESLPMTQVSCSDSKHISNSSNISGISSNLALSSVTTTHAYNTDAQNIHENEMLLNQTFTTITKKEKTDSHSSLFFNDSLDLPPTQVSKISSKQNVTCLNVNKSVTSPDTQFSNTTDFHNNEFPLPDTEILSLNPKELNAINPNNEQNESVSKNNLNKIISNIKQLVNSLSLKVSGNHKLHNVSTEISTNELVTNFKNDNIPNNSMDLNETAGSKNILSGEENVLSNNSKCVLPENSKESLSFINNEKENQTVEQSSDNSDNEEFSLEKFKESLKTSNLVSPKKSGVHKHLPQVIATVPVKENLKIKPSNKRTFSFEEVVKLQASTIEENSSSNVSAEYEVYNNKALGKHENELNEFIDTDNLPATQLCNNPVSANLDEIQKLSHDNIETSVIESHQNNESKLKNDYFIKNPSKRKKSSDEIMKSKRICKQPESKSYNNWKNTNVNEQKILNKSLSTLEDSEDHKVKMINHTENSFSVNSNQENHVCDKKFIFKKHVDHALSVDCEKTLSSNINDDCEDISTNIKIKQEKDDFEFFKLSFDLQKFNSSVPICDNLKVVKTEKLDSDDNFQSPTQVFNFNHSEDNSLPQTQVTDMNFANINKNISEKESICIQNSFLSPSKIKKELHSDDDDDISIIELDAKQHPKIKEEIILIDDEDGSFNYNSKSLHFQMEQGQKVLSEIVDVSSIKKEKCSEANIISECELEIKGSNITYEKSRNSAQKCVKDNKKERDDCTVSKNDFQNHKHDKSIENMENSVEPSTDIGDVESSKNLHVSKEKNKKNLIDHTSGKKGTKSKKYVSEETNKTLENFPQCNENNNIPMLTKKKSCSKEFKLSKKETGDTSNPQLSYEKNNKEFQESSSEKDIKFKSIEALVSKKNKDKITTDAHIKTQHKNKDDYKESISKSKEKVNKSRSLSKNVDHNAKQSAIVKDSLSKNSSKLTKNINSKNGTITNQIKKDEQSNFERESNKHYKEMAEGKSDRDKKCSEKENRNKNNREFIIALKPVKKSSSDSFNLCNSKKIKLEHSLDSESNTSEDVSIQLSDVRTDFYKHSNLNSGMHLGPDSVFNELSASKDIENANQKSNKHLSKSSSSTATKKVHGKQNLMEEIANEVKLVLKPFYNTGLISKDDYKDIMRRAVPKIFVNCHSVINPEKIRKLILNYVSLLSNKSWQ